jgi:hypothetical protein
MQGNKAITSAMIVGIGALLVLAGFFLPWIQFVQMAKVSGFDTASVVVYLWLLPIAAVVGLGWAIYVVNQGSVDRTLAFVATGTAVVALLMAVIFLIRYSSGLALTQDFAVGILGEMAAVIVQDMVKLQYGIWVTFAGTIAMLVGAGLSFMAEQGYGVVTTVQMSSIGSSPPPLNLNNAPPPTQAAPQQPTVPQSPPSSSPSPSTPREPTQQIGVPAAPEGWLVLRSGSRAGQQFGLTRGRRNTVGRDPNRADIVVDHSTVSGEHARIQFEGGQFYLYDLASTNGSFVNNRRVQRQMLRDGDIVRLGDMKFVFKRVT